MTREPFMLMQLQVLTRRYKGGELVRYGEDGDMIMRVGI